MHCLLLIISIYYAGQLDFVSARATRAACHSQIPNAKDFLSTKTPYSPEMTIDKYSIPAGCTARQLWILIRHGTRNPGRDDLQQMKETLPKLKDKILLNSRNNLCQADRDRLKMWSGTMLNPSMENILVQRGYDELRGISNRFQMKFSDLFPKDYSKDVYNFQHTIEQRTKESAKAFVEAIFGSAGVGSVEFPEVPKEDRLLQFYKTCRKWKKQVEDNPKAGCEPYRFRNSCPFEELTTRISDRLGIEDRSSLSANDILLMYKTCCFETAWNTPMTSSWCSVFNEEDFRALEYLEDLEDFWQDGYAYPVTYEQACEPIKDLVTRFSNRTSNDKNPLKTTVYFAHSGTILKLYARLGLFKDSKNLTSADYETFKSKREWRNSKIGTFASNIAFTLFECTPDPKYRVQTFVQETPIAFPLAGGKSLIPFDEFARSLQKIVDGCDLQEICKLK